MEPYDDMTPAERFELLDEMASEYFGTARWKSAWCRRYGFTNQTLTDWRNRGAPIWAVVAMEDALHRQKLETAVRSIQALAPPR